ncbi:MAG: hypothetical protein OEV85_06105 [Candidatus Thorarchaeota archaeon]|nr:hypothetical protein [Candidatus Thorarchaeota archaeon]
MHFKHVFILMILILPMFAFAPTLVANQNETLVSLSKVDTSLPSSFIQETLRVAVYAEDNTTLPLYASGGVSTAHHANLIQYLESIGFAVTALSTQDILDHKLMTASFDVFVLPNNLPKDNIVNYVMEYWLGGGGILSFDSGLGFLYYHGMIVLGDTGNYALLDIDPSAHWGFDYVGNVTVGARHSSAKSYQVDDIIYILENTTIHDRFYFAGANVADFVPLFFETGVSDTTVGFALDNSERQGGRIVQLPGNCSTIPAWEKSVISDSINWLAPKPKGRILFDLTHMPYYGVDLWDSDYVVAPTLHTDMRNFLVNHTYTFDKLYPSASGNLTASNLASYDIVIVFEPYINFTAQEVADFTNWINSGGSILATTDHIAESSSNMNYLLSNTDIAANLTQVGTNALYTTGYHPIQEGCSTLSCLAPGSVAITGSAFSIWEDAIGIPVIGGDEHGDGRVILITDGAILRDGRIDAVDNAQALINFANWLSAATAEVLLYVDNPTLLNPYLAPAVDALNDLGIPFYITYTEYYMNLSLYSQSWDLLILDSPWPGIFPYFDDFSSYIDSGGKMIVSWHMMDTYPSSPLYSKIGFGFSAELPDSVPFYIWNSGHGIFNYPNNYGALNFTSVDDYGDEGDLMTVYSNATVLGGFTQTNQAGNATIVLGFGGHVLWNSYLIDQFTGDYDDSTYLDTFELWENEIAFMYYDRPTIDHPADVTYMETETGNEIVWTPSADAGPWEYVLRVNGTIDSTVHWSGGPVAINVDGINASITEFELTVYDRLGYSVSDLVVLNVTEYVAPPPGGGDIDPLILIAVGAGIVIVVVIILIVMQKNKKK